MLKKGEKGKTIEDLNKDNPNEIGELVEASFICMGENDLKIFKTEFPDKWKKLTKELEYPYEFFNCIEEYQNLLTFQRKNTSSVN